jgi:hypothetical protein
MPLSFDDRTVRNTSCETCGQDFQHVTGYVNVEGGAYAVYFAACHGHPEHEAQIDVVLGSWGVEPPIDDFLTFSCTLRPDGAVAVDATVATTSDDALLGIRLLRAEALAHPRVEDFWAVVDFLAQSDPTIHATVYGSSASELVTGSLARLRRGFRGRT